MRVSLSPPTRRPVWPGVLLAGGLAACLALLTPAGAQAATPGCDDHLVTHTPTGTEGDGAAVAITSQLVDADQPGWVHAQWAAAEGTELTAVLALTLDEEVQELAPESSGFVEDVLSLTFCGTTASEEGAEETDDSEASGQDDEASGQDGEASDDEGEAEAAATTDEASSSERSTDSSTAASTDAAQDTDGDGGDADDSAATTSIEVAAELPEADLRDDPEVEVLSVTMARADSGDGDRPEQDAAQGSTQDAEEAAQASATGADARGIGGPTVLVASLLAALAVLTVAGWWRRQRIRREVG